MATTVWGVVKDGQVIPDRPLPEGAHVEIRVEDPAVEVPPELQAEFEAWDRASGEALKRVEDLAREGQPDETR